MSDTLDFGEVAQAQSLLDEIVQQRDFPALSQVVSQVTRLADSEDAHADDLTESILRDVSLTNKLLRIVNSAHYGQFGDTPINTVSRAIIILGFDNVRHAALSLMLFDHLANRAQAAELKAEAVESFYRGIIGRQLAAKAGMRNTEEVLISGLFRNLGRMMCRLYFHPKTQQVTELQASQGLSEEIASRRVFGLSYDEFGQSLGHHWHLPATLLQGMTPLPPGPVKTPANEAARVQILASMADALYEAVRDNEGEALHQAIIAVAKKFGQAVPVNPEALVAILQQAGEDMEREARILQVDLKTSPLMRRLLAQPAEEAKSGGKAEDGIQELAEVASGTDPTAILITGLQDLTTMLLDNANTGDLLHVAAELLYRSRCFDHIVISGVAPSGKELVGRIGFGPQAERLKKGMRIPLSFTPDVFHAAISKGVDLMIADSRADNIRERIPAWYAEKINAKSFLLLPISVGNRTVALIYADRQDRSLQLPPQTLGLMKALRNQITLALRQKSA